MTRELHQELRFYDFTAPYAMWRALGAVGIGSIPIEGGPAGVDWGRGSKADRQEAYVLELLERAKGAVRAGGGHLDAYSDAEMVSRAIEIYGADRMSRSLSALASALNNLQLQIEMKRLPEAVAEYLHEITQELYAKRIS